MKRDISEILKDWPYEPGSVSARRIMGADGTESIQLRLDLGLLQMEVVGRPDGERPYGCESVLDYYEKTIREFSDDAEGEKQPKLDGVACEEIRAEAVLYYHRYLAEFVLEDYEAVERDTVRNLQAMDMCLNYAADEGDRQAMEQYRPYVIMMCARARALVSFEQNRPKEALSAVRRGIEQIEAFHHSHGLDEAVDESGEIEVLGAMAREITARIPVGPIERLRRDLAKAVEEERYEEAAAIRDQLQHANANNAAPGGEEKL